eukprot:scaffold109437_cov54-Phaeocystis_antarctica.AAC.1
MLSHVDRPSSHTCQSRPADTSLTKPAPLTLRRGETAFYTVARLRFITRNKSGRVEGGSAHVVGGCGVLPWRVGSQLFQRLLWFISEVRSLQDLRQQEEGTTNASLGLCLDVRGYCSRRFHVQSFGHVSKALPEERRRCICIGRCRGPAAHLKKKTRVE